MFDFKKAVLLLGLLSSSVVTASLAFAAETAPGINNFKKPFNEYTWVIAHNGYQDDKRTQLDRGVRGFMLDLHPGNLGSKDVYLCHTTGKGTCDVRRDKNFTDSLSKVFLPFLRANPNAVVTLTLENYVDRATLQNALARVPGLEDWVFDPAPYAGTSSWPTLEQMIRSGRRLVILTDRHEGSYRIRGKTINLLKDSLWENQNHWELGITAFKHDWSCPARWHTYASSVGVGGFERWPRLFIMNQFHAWGSTAAHAADVDNNLTRLERRVDRYCAAAQGRRTAPNFLAIDFNQTGDAFAYAAALTQGGFYFHEKNRADPTGDTTCVIPAGQRHNLRLPGRGCENDEARSLKLRGIAKGTRISVYDSPAASTQDDYAVIDIKRDIGLNESVVVDTFEKSYESADLKVVYVRNNGLDGKVSRVITGTTPTNFSDASVVLYEGNSARQNVVCTVSLAGSSRFNFGGSCDNDEARSAKILKAKAGTRFWVYGNKDQKGNQGWARVEVLSDITQPVVVGSFEKSHSTAAWRIIRGGSKTQLDGKISSMKVERP